jgi:uncharacterized protein YdeI (YjbR/CyaY-like superfamily)
MGKRDARIDDYIAKAPDYARPILIYLRKAVHDACPDVEETMKWSRPSFARKGMICVMSAFKHYCVFMFWKRKLIPGLNEDRDGEKEQGGGRLEKITGVADLPSGRMLRGHIQAAVRLNEKGIKLPGRPKNAARKPLVIPPVLKAALKKSKKAHATFEGFSYSHQKEYVEWITGAKTEETRNRRLATALEWLAEGKPRNWKYQKC